MPEFSYLTIEAATQGIYKEKGSKFMAFAFPVESQEEVKLRLLELRKAYYDARHHCYAYVLGAKKERFRAADDGEPNHSAGDPILSQIRSKNLTNVLIVVVRYFGGVKLGVGGLAQAYKAAAADALENSKTVQLEIMEVISLTYDYSAMPEVMRLLKEFDIVVLRQDFTEGCYMDLQLRLRLAKAFQEKLNLLKALGVKVSMHSKWKS
jgi:uncharacterized YigZ family protein